MKIFLISDNIDTLVGMRLAGVKGIVVHTKDEVNNEIDEVLAKKEVGILLITEKLASLVPERISTMKLDKGLPLVVEIPDRHGMKKEKEFLTRHIKESIGIKI